MKNNSNKNLYKKYIKYTNEIKNIKKRYINVIIEYILNHGKIDEFYENEKYIDIGCVVIPFESNNNILVTEVRVSSNKLNIITNENGYYSENNHSANDASIDTLYSIIELFESRYNTIII